MSNQLLKTAVKAAIPIITVHHLDILNISTVLKAILKTKVVEYPLGNDFDPNKATLNKSKLFAFEVFYTSNPDFKCNEALYNWLVSNEKTLVIINNHDSNYSFDAGAITLPTTHLKTLLGDYLDVETIEAITPSLKGLTIKAITELLRITTAQEGTVNINNIIKNRSLVTSGAQGLNKVDNSISLYLPNPELQEYIKINTSFFTNKDVPEALVPRGILLAGIPGTGKTVAAKHISNIFEVPLYRLDLSASLSKFVGSSERNLAAILAAVEQESPCVLLIDEAEKLFGEGEDSGVTSRLLAQLLWFLQEHKSRIFTVITTNNVHKLPPELYRQGRIDKVLILEALQQPEAIALAFKVLEQFVKITPSIEDIVRKEILSLNVEYTPALITGLMYTLTKKNNWTNA